MCAVFFRGVDVGGRFMYVGQFVCLYVIDVIFFIRVWYVLIRTGNAKTKKFGCDFDI